MNPSNSAPHPSRDDTSFFMQILLRERAREKELENVRIRQYAKTFRRQNTVPRDDFGIT